MHPHQGSMTYSRHEFMTADVKTDEKFKSDT
jgi:hypothetical protein